MELQVVVIPRKLSAEVGGAADTAENVFGWAANQGRHERALSACHAALT